MLLDVLTPELIRAIRRDYRLHWRGIHGVNHWARVLENGIRLSASSGARLPVVQLFAVFHDSRRFNDGSDPNHGRRGAAFAKKLRDSFFHLPDQDFDLLTIACADHTLGKTAADVTIQTCWDADRLDLGRVGIRPEPGYLCTQAAKDPALIAWAYQRSISPAVPSVVNDWEA